MSQMQDERRKEIAKRTQALEAIDLDIQAQRKQIMDLQTKKGQTGRPTKQEYNPSNVQGGKNAISGPCELFVFSLWRSVY